MKIEQIQRIVIFGNSGSGKTTMACALARRHGLAHLDWARAYERRTDEFSLARHRSIFDGFASPKREITAVLPTPAPMDLSSELAALLGALVGALAAVTSGLLAYRLGVGRIKAETRAVHRKQWMNRTFETLTDVIVTCEHVPADWVQLTRSLVELELLRDLK